MKKLKSIVCAALCVSIIAVPLTSSVVFNAGAEDVKSLQQKIDELDAKSDEYQAILDQTQTDIGEKEAYGQALVSKIQVLNEKVVLTRQSIDSLNTDISEKQTEIDKGNKDIDGQVDALCDRLSIIYMAGSASNLEILLGAKDFGDFIDKVSLVKTLSEYDKQMINDINSKLDAIEAQKASLEKDKTSLETQEASLKSDMDDLNKLLQENEAVLTELTAKSEAARTALQNTNSETAKLEAQQAAEVAKQQAAAKTAAASAQQQAAAKQAAARQQQQEAAARQQSGTTPTQGNSDDDDSEDYEPVTPQPVPDEPAVPSGGGYTWPCPGFYYLSSLWNEDRYTYNHGAIDIAGGGILGAAVVAAESGTVIDTCTYCTHNWGKSGSCGCGGGYGNYVWMSHGNGKETIYAHLTSLIVSPGQSVSKGQVIGYVGSTGYSTGPHLHFECRYNDSKYNPMDELSAYWGMVSY